MSGAQSSGSRLIISVVEFTISFKVQDAPSKESLPAAGLRMENSPSIQGPAGKTFQKPSNNLPIHVVYLVVSLFFRTFALSILKLASEKRHPRVLYIVKQTAASGPEPSA